MKNKVKIASLCLVLFILGSLFSFNGAGAFEVQNSDIKETILPVGNPILDISKADVDVQENYEYTGISITPVVCSYQGTELIKDKDYTITYYNNLYVGQASFVIRGIRNYCGEIKGTFNITKISKNIVCTLSSATYTYNGDKKMPDVVVKHGPYELIYGNDYTVSYKNNVNAGKAKAIIKLNGDYEGTIEKTFTIKPKSISGAKIKISKTKYNYTGKSIKPTVTVKVGSKTIPKSMLLLSYKNNKKVGNATVRIKAKGNYYGSKTVKFQIYPKINKTSLTLYKGDKSKLSVKSSAKVRFTSSNKKVVTINSKGIITTLNKGKSYITITSNKKSIKVKITVKNPYVKVQKSAIVYIKCSKKLTVSKGPSSAKITWYSSNTRVAKVSSKGVVKGLSSGKAIITAKITYKGKSYYSYSKITVKPVKKYYEGMYKVGRDIPAGQYVLYTTSKYSGYFSINRDSSGLLESIISNDNFYNNSIIRVYNGEYLELDGCYAINILYAPKIKNYSEGAMFKVGRDIEPGEYKLTVSSKYSGYYEIDSDCRHLLEDIIANDNFYNTTYITVKSGQYLLLDGCYLSYYYG